MKEGIIKLDSELGKEIGFESRWFEPWSYLWSKGGYILISMIGSKYPGKGHFKELVHNIESKGYKVLVPTPSKRLRAILISLGFRGHIVNTRNGKIELWQRDELVPSDMEI